MSPIDRAGFTLIELMVAISIVVVLLAMLAIVTLKYRLRAQLDRTRGFVEELRITIQDYKSATGHFPPDGIDGELLSEESRTPLQSGAALAHALTQPYLRKTQRPDGSFAEELVEPERPLKRADLLVPDDDGPQVAELVDVWGNPFHYDCLDTAEMYSPQGDASVHLVSAAVHQEDPREAVDVAVRAAGPQNVGSYDLWSHGPKGHSSEELPAEAIGNWSQVDKDEGSKP